MKEKHQWNQAERGKNPFIVPDGYFEGLEEQIMSRIRAEQEQKPRKTSQRRLLYWVSGVAAALLIGFIGYQQFVRPAATQPVDEDTMLAVVEYFAQDFDDLSMANLMAENDLLDEGVDRSDGDLLDYMNIDDLTILEVLSNGN